jgi:putative DNA primase/helicase
VSQGELERSVLGAVLLNSRLYDQAAKLRPEDFSLESHCRIFLRMGDLARTDCPIDIVTVVEELERHKELQSVGDVDYVAGLVDGVQDRPSISHYVKMLRRTGDRRRAAKLVENGYQLAEDPSVSTTALAELGQDLSVLASGVEALPPQFSEEALALRFSRKYEGELRYVAGWGRWMCWDGTRWREDNTLTVFDRCRAICRCASSECGDAKERAAMKIASAQTVAAIERLARADRRHAAVVEQFDADPLVLNTPAGTVDLHTGELHGHEREQYLTKMTAAAPRKDCPLWRCFLQRVTDGDFELQEFLQRVIGYCLTGSTREHALFFLYGTGANGKSVFLSTIAGLLDDYAKSAPASAFTASSTEQHPTDVAGLRGARFVTATETEDGRWWAEAKIKNLTGGDRVTARFMRQDFFEYVPQFKLVIAGNHKPGLRSVDEAIRRRLHLIPFTVTIPRDERNPRLGEKLRAEFAGILSWAIQGCLAWQREGLNPPDVVREATANYLADEDAFGCWLEDRCNIGAAYWTPGSVLFSDHKEWLERTGERVPSQKRFTQSLESRGFVQERTSAARGFRGIRLRARVTDMTDSLVVHVPRARTLNMRERVTSVTEDQATHATQSD